MTGAVQAAAAAAAASIGVTAVLFDAGSGQVVAGNGNGSVSPNNFKGSGLYFDSANTRDFFLQTISAAAPQESFVQIRVQDSNGAWRTFARSAATFNDVGASGKTWYWGTGSNRVWQTTDAGESKIIVFDGV